jgi:NAD(P)-dependent dehydrogenase (short-subunit alcohol dehydrogenase family)
MNVPSVVLVTGASGGIGKACAEYLAGKGFHVYGTSRRAAETPSPSGRLVMIRMDITDSRSVAEGIRLVHEREGRVDAVVNNAGALVVGPVEDVPIAEVEKNVQTNCLGALRVCQAVIPLMRAQGGGKIINVSSVGGAIGLPFEGIYSTGKFALEGMSEALRIELRHFGITVSLIQPGDVRTQDCRNVVATSKAYEPWFSNAVKQYEADEEKGYPPEKMGPLVERILLSANPRFRYSFGGPFQSMVPFLKRLLPQRFVQWAFCQIYKT